MRRILFGLAAIFAFLLAWLASPDAHAQSSGVIVLDKNKAAVTKLVDGDSIQLRVKLASQARQPTRISFALEPDKTTVAECTVRVGGDSCDTERFGALGWYWDKSAGPQPERPISAIANGTTVASAQVQIAPRPVVRRHLL